MHKPPLAVWRQFLAPQHALTRFAGFMSHCQIPWLKNYLIRWFLKRYPVNLDEALESDPHAYPSFHEFFIRRLKSELRPIDTSAKVICSPCDGTISQIGKIEQGSLLQAKGRMFSIETLLGGDCEKARAFLNGHFATIYLAPKDYHRVHMPYAGALQNLRYIPGKLFSVNPLTTEHIKNLFAQNERVITFFKHDHGSFAIILVGAMIVGSIFTRWGGYLIPRGKNIIEVQYSKHPDQYIKLDKGEEMGYFSLGSTVILLFAENIGWEHGLTQSTQLVVGQRIGHFLP